MFSQTQAPRITLAGLALTGLALTLAPRTAEACGGTFCDNTGGVPMPVDQRGEDILFVQDGPTIEAHVRIEYNGEAERFAWIVPLQGVPEVSVGSEPLFNQLAAAAAPSWTATREYQCPDEEPGGDEGGVFVPASDLGAASEDPDIVLEETVGSFEVVVLQAGDATELIDFLIANDYAQDPDAAPIIQEYLDEGFLFAAVKLTADVDVDAIHPLVFRVTSDEPCVPIRLTRIAAEEDMGIRAYFLGANRWAPRNYAHVVLNTLRFPWNQASSQFSGFAHYVAQLALAVDEAGGRAFATDYAGPANIVDETGVYSPAWDEGPFVFADPITAIDLIADQGLNTHPLIQALLMQFIPPPDGVPALQFWNNLEGFADQIDMDAWDGPAFAAALSEQIIEPGLHAVDLLDAWPYLTRLHTLMSPHEMLVDPTFQPAPDLGLVDNVITAEGLDFCGEGTGDRYLVPWSGQQVPVCRDDEDASAWPLADMPAALRVEEIPMVGPAQVIEDNSAAIVEAWQAHQATTACAGDPGGDDGGTEGGMDTGGDEAGEGDTGAGLDEGGDAKAGCACSSDPSSPAGLAFALFGLAGVFLASRRPRGRA